MYDDKYKQVHNYLAWSGIEVMIGLVSQPYMMQIEARLSSFTAGVYPGKFPLLIASVL